MHINQTNNNLQCFCPANDKLDKLQDQQLRDGSTSIENFESSTKNIKCLMSLLSKYYCIPSWSIQQVRIRDRQRTSTHTLWCQYLISAMVILANTDFNLMFFFSTFFFKCFFLKLHKLI